MRRDRLDTDYFDWLCDLVCTSRQTSKITFDRLMEHLHDTDFRYLHPNDHNRASDGIDLRWRFGSDLQGPCSVLEMLVALAIRCEETIMDDPTYGDRTGQWFWTMIINLGLGSMHDLRYDEQRVTDAIEHFLDRDYSPDGRGGLFRIKDSDRDACDMSIWAQAMWYLGTTP